MRVLLATAMAAGLALTASPAFANDPIDWPWVCVQYPCYPTDYPPFLLGQLGDEVTVDVNGPVVCVTEPCDQPPLLEVCVERLGECTEVYVW